MFDTIAPPVLPAAQLERLDARFPERSVALGTGVHVSVRECGAAQDGVLPLVCLHGIGSGAASWLELALLLAPRTRVVAWDAPGYGASSPLPMDAPRGGDYALRLHELLEALGVARCVLVGHSLGALMAAPAVCSAPERYAALALISPAGGYGAAARAEARRSVRVQRLQTLADLGIAGMAAQRSARLVSRNASPLARAWVHWNMTRLHERGYRQAIELLCTSDLLACLPAPLPVHVACGVLDVVTPPQACGEVAEAAGVALYPIADAGHASYVEQPAAVAQWLAGVLDAVMGAAPAP